MPRPIRIFCGGLTNRVWAARRYSERADGRFLVTNKDDVTDEAIASVAHHVEHCEDRACLCQGLSFARSPDGAAGEPGLPTRESVSPETARMIEQAQRGF